MARDTIFETKAEMTKSDVVVRTALSSDESKDARLPGERNNPDMQVKSVERPRFGHGY